MRCCGDENKMGYESVKNAVMNLLQVQGDTSGRNLMKYMSAAKDVYIDLNFSTIKDTKRYWVTVDPATKRIQLPDDFFHFSSLSVLDECNNLETLVVNTNLIADIVDISMDKDCHCDCGCHSKECGMIQNYEVIYEDVPAPMPDGSVKVFQAYTRKKINKDGSFIQEETYPTAIYDGNVWTDTRLVTTEKFLCKLEVKPCGCIKDTPKNKECIAACCSPAVFPTDCGCTVCSTPCNVPTYNILDNRHQIQFPSDFPYDKVLLRYYYDAPTDKLSIPRLARKTFQAGVLSFVADVDKNETEYRITRFFKQYHFLKGQLKKRLNRYSIKTYYAYVLGRRIMP